MCLELQAVCLTKGIVDQGVRNVSVGLILKGLHVAGCPLHIITWT